MLLLEEAIIEKLRGGPCCFDEIAHQRTPVWMDEAMNTCLLRFLDRPFSHFIPDPFVC